MMSTISVRTLKKYMLVTDGGQLGIYSIKYLWLSDINVTLYLVLTRWRLSQIEEF